MTCVPALGKIQVKFLCVLFLSFGILCVMFSPQAQANGTSPSVLSLPQGPGSLGGIGENVSANLNMGLMIYPIKVVLPEGRGGFSPSIGISYSSSFGSGVMGIGWSLSAGSRIERLTVRGLPTYTNDDKFYAGTGEIVKIPNSSFYRSRVEGAFVRYRWHQSSAKDQKGYWTAEYPNGDVGYFGVDSKGKQDLGSHVSGLKGTFRWELRSKIDRNGNRIEYSYLRSGSQTYLEKVEWVFAKDGTALYRAELLYEDRPDPTSDGKPGFDLSTNKRLKEIVIYSSGQRIRSYSFAFDDASGLSRLLKATRYGLDPKKAFPVLFSMKYSNAVVSAENSRMEKMPTSLGVNFNSGNADLLDVNGDGLPDVVNTTNKKHRFHINVLSLDKDLKQVKDKHDFPTNRIVENTKEVSAKLSNPSVQLLDYNGDGYTDMVDAVTWKIYINKGNSKWEDQSATLAKSFPITQSEPNMRFFDYNGDKAIDIIRSQSGSTTYWISDGKGNWTKVDNKKPIGASFQNDKLRLIDMNGDGLSDAVKIIEGELNYKKYLGYGVWTDWIKIKVDGLSSSHADKAQFADMNGDGLADMVVFLSSSIMYFINRNGRSFEKGQTLKSFGKVDLPSNGQSAIRIADINGNGSRDIVWIDSSGKVTYLELFGERPNLLKEISNGIGQRIQLTYGSSVYHQLRDEVCDPKSDTTCEGPWLNKLPMAFPVVNQIQTWPERKANEKANEATKPRIQRIFYHHGFYDGNEKKFRGFRKVQSVMVGDDTAMRRQDENIYNVGDKDSYFHGKLLSSTTSNGKEHVYHKATLVWKDCGTPKGADPNLNPPVRFICMESSEKEIIEGIADKTKWKLTRSEQTYDGYGNVLQSAQLGEKGKDGDEKYIRYSYITPKDPKSETSPWQLRLRQYGEICSSLSGPCAKTEYYYDGEPFQGLAQGQFTKGNVTRVSAKPSTAGADIPIRRVKRDEHGNIIEIKDPNGHLRSVVWDAQFQRFPEKETLHLDGYMLSMSTKWDVRYSIILQSTDFNGNVTRYSYDEFGRQIGTFLPKDSNDKPSVRYEYDMKSPISRIITYRRSKQDGAEDQKTIICYDGVGRKLQERVQVSSGRFLVSSFVEYNSQNLVSRRWNTYTSTKEGCSFTPPTNVPFLQFFYDGMGRAIKGVRQDKAELRYVFEPFKITYYDEEDNRKDSPHFNTPAVLHKDGLGRTIEKIEFKEPGKQVRMQYKWSFVNTKGQNIATEMIDAAGHKKTQEFDLLGRVTKIVDPDRKTILYTYDNAGNMLQRKDEQGRTVVYTYDALNRIKTIQEAGKKETTIEHVYDRPVPALKGTNLKGKISALLYPGGKDFFSYDEHGQTVQHQRELLGVSFLFQFKYDHLSRLIEKIVPDGRKLNYRYDGANRVTSMEPLVQKLDYGESGLLSRYIHGNGVETTMTYNKRNLHQNVSVAGGSIWEGVYSYDSTNNLLSIMERRGSKEEKHSYKYNSMYQLTQAKIANETLSYAYDDIGNVTSKTSSLGDKSLSHIGTYTYDPNRPRAVMQAGKSKFVYDKSGHLTQEGTMKYRKDYLGRRTHTLRDDKVVGRYWYGPTMSSGSTLEGADAFLQRTIKMEDGLHTFYVLPGYEVRGKNSIIYVRLGKRRLAAWKSKNNLNTIYDDLAPAEGTGTLTAKPNQTINVADAWLYHATRKNLVKMELKERSVDVDLTQDMLRVSLENLLQPSRESKVFFHHNHLGSTVAVTDEAKQVVAQKSYYPFGMIRSKKGDEFSYGYAGLECDTLTKHNYAQSRYLDARLGRWMSADRQFDTIQSVNDEFNSYAYVQNNPVVLIDSDGTISKKTMAKVCIGLVGAASGIAWLAGTIQSEQDSAKSSLVANVIASSTAAIAGVLGAIGMGSKRGNFAKAAGAVGIASGIAWVVATNLDATADGQSDHAGQAGNYAASGLAIIAGVAGLASSILGDNKRKTRRRTAAALGIGAGVAALGSGVFWAIGADPSDGATGGQSNFIGAVLSGVIGAVGIGFGIKSYYKAHKSIRNKPARVAARRAKKSKKAKKRRRKSK